MTAPVIAGHGVAQPASDFAVHRPHEHRKNDPRHCPAHEARGSGRIQRRQRELAQVREPIWATELASNHVDTVWPYWNLMDFTPAGRPDIPVPPQEFRSKFLEKNYLNKED